MQSRPRMIIFASLCVLIAVNCADAISSDALLIKRLLAANQPPGDASAGSSVSGGTDNGTVLRAQDAGDHRARAATDGGSPRSGNPPSVDHATSSNRKSRVRRSPSPNGWFRMTCPRGQVYVGGKCCKIIGRKRNMSKPRKS